MKLRALMIAGVLLVGPLFSAHAQVTSKNWTGPRGSHGTSYQGTGANGSKGAGSTFETPGGASGKVGGVVGPNGTKAAGAIVEMPDGSKKVVGGIKTPNGKAAAFGAQKQADGSANAAWKATGPNGSASGGGSRSADGVISRGSTIQDTEGNTIRSKNIYRDPNTNTRIKESTTNTASGTVKRTSYRGPYSGTENGYSSEGYGRFVSVETENGTAVRGRGYGTVTDPEGNTYTGVSKVLKGPSGSSANSFRGWTENGTYISAQSANNSEGEPQASRLLVFDPETGAWSIVKVDAEGNVTSNEGNINNPEDPSREGAATAPEESVANEEEGSNESVASNL